MTSSMHSAMSLDGDPSKLASFYDQWASTYDQDLAPSYGMPNMMVKTLKRAIRTDERFEHMRDPKVRIVDAGCGTGAVGQQLYDSGWQELHGVDLSTEMVKVAEQRNVYSTLRGGIDLTRPLASGLAASADIVTVGGVFTVGHVPPGTLEQIAAMVKPGGLLVISTREAYLDETNFAEVEHRLVDNSVLERVVHIQAAPYTMDSTGDYWAWVVPQA